MDSMWAFRELLPVASDTEPVTLGEGRTPLVRALHAEAYVPKAPHVWLKLESLNPTGSFKDRPVSVAVTKARELGYDGLITASSGNAGASLSAYAARAKLPSVTLVPHGLPSSKLAQIGRYGTRLVAVRGHFSRAFGLARAVADETGWYNVTSTFLSAYPTEGDKTVAYELVLVLGTVPDWVVVPVGSGPLLVGALKGFRELMHFGVIDRVPRMVAVQATGCAPIARAFQHGEASVRAWDTPATIASGINDPLQGYAEDGTLTLTCVRETDGRVIAVDDAEIMGAVEYLASQEGVLAEPTGAAGVAGLRRLAEGGAIGREEQVAVLVTGHGLKDVQALAASVSAPPVIEPEANALRAILASDT